MDMENVQLQLSIQLRWHGQPAFWKRAGNALLKQNNAVKKRTKSIKSEYCSTTESGFFVFLTFILSSSSINFGKTTDNAIDFQRRRDYTPGSISGYRDGLTAVIQDKVVLGVTEFFRSTCNKNIIITKKVLQASNLKKKITSKK